VAATTAPAARAGLAPLPAAGAVLVVLAIAAHLVWPDGVAGDASFLFVTVGAACGAWWRARGHADPTVARLIATGLTLSALADASYRVYLWRGAAPDISVADLGWLGSYAGIGAALLVILRGRDGERRDVEGILDIGSVATLAMFLQWQLGLHDVVNDSSVPVPVRFVWALYPAFDAVLLALIVRAAVAGRLHAFGAMLLGAGVSCWLVSDFVFTIFEYRDDLTRFLDAGWMLGAVLLAGAAPRVARVRRAPDAPPRPSVGHVRLAIGLLPLLVPVAVDFADHVRKSEIVGAEVFVTTSVLLALVWARAAFLTRAERRARDLLHARERFADAIARNSSDAVVLLDAAGRIVGDTASIASVFGYAVDELRGEDAISAVVPDDRGEARETFGRCLLSPAKTFETEVRVLRGDGRIVWAHLRVVNLLHDADVGAIVLNIHDITARKRAEDEIAHQAFHDALTGLANRALFFDRIEQALRRHARSGRDTAVLFLDLDGFKTVNDSLGHAAGDDMLRQVAHRLSRSVRDGDTVARLGGDEFGVLIEDSRDALREAQVVAERILETLSTPFTIAEHLLALSASIGIAGGDAAATATSLVRDADVAMYRAKTSGKAQWLLYDSEMRTAAAERLRLATDLATALERDEFALVYQPVIELQTDRVVAFEALLRWHHPELGLVRPDRFIPLAEESGLIVPIGRWVLDQACKAASRWRREFPELSDLAIAVNVSGRQLTARSFVDDVTHALADAGLDPTALVLEITETSLVHDSLAAAARLHEVHALGIRLAIDDFGTGYSSLSYLRQFPFDILKIDQSYIEGIVERDGLPALVRAMLDLGRTLQLEVVAEGVEQEVQRDHLRLEHCDLAQGYLFAQPLTDVDAQALLVREAQRRKRAHAPS